MAVPTRQPELDDTDLDLLRRRVVNVVGHELRTPVSVVRGLAEQLMHADPDTVRTELVPALVRSARRAEQLLDDLLVSSGISTALPVGDPVPVDVRAVLDDVWTTLDAGIELQVDGSDPVALCHPDGIRRILLHVLDNEVKYGDGSVRVEIHQSGDTVRIAVPAPRFQRGEEIRLAFEPLFRGEHGVTSAAGIGVGLSTARALARHDRGDISIDDHDGPVKVVVTLPAA